MYGRRIYNLVALRLKGTWSHYQFLKHTAEEQGRFPPSTAAMIPAPGKKFMIVRQEIDHTPAAPPQTFEQISQTTGAGVISYDDDGATASYAGSSGSGKKKKSLLDKMIALSAGAGSITPTPALDDGSSPKLVSLTGSWDDELASTRRETAEARIRSPSLASTTSLGAVDNAELQAPTAVPEEPANPFRFILAMVQPTGPPLERSLTVPRLPMAAQDAVRSMTWQPVPDLPPPPPPPASYVSTDMEIGLGIQKDGGLGIAEDRENEGSIAGTDVSTAPSGETTRQSFEDLTRPCRPLGMSPHNAAYSGRALAEWSQVVFECNHFADRRRQEGVVSLKDVEVPALMVDGFQGIGG